MFLVSISYIDGEEFCDLKLVDMLFSGFSFYITVAIATDKKKESNLKKTVKS